MFRRSSPPPVLPPQETPGLAEAKAAKARARQGFVDAVKSGEESRKMVDRMATLLRENHFGPTVYDAVMRNHP